MQDAHPPVVQQARAHEEVARNVDEHGRIREMVGCRLEERRAGQFSGGQSLGLAVGVDDGEIVQEEQ